MEKFKKWTEEEREMVLDALSEIPEILWSNSTVNVYRMRKSETSMGNTATSAEGIIVLYDAAFSAISPTRPLPRVLAHELAHEMYRRFSNKQIGSYLEGTSWFSLDFTENEGDGQWKTNRTKFVEMDGSESPDEDFANNIEYFIFNPTKLRLFSPNIHTWIDHHYGDKLRLRKPTKDNK
jgi:hypothetical protein